MEINSINRYQVFVLFVVLFFTLRIFLKV